MDSPFAERCEEPASGFGRPENRLAVESHKVVKGCFRQMIEVRRLKAAGELQPSQLPQHAGPAQVRYHCSRRFALASELVESESRNLRRDRCREDVAQVRSVVEAETQAADRRRSEQFGKGFPEFVHVF